MLLSAAGQAVGSQCARSHSYAETGVEFLAVGALTHSVTALDIGLDVQET